MNPPVEAPTSRQSVPAGSTPSALERVRELLAAARDEARRPLDLERGRLVDLRRPACRSPGTRPAITSACAWRASPRGRARRAGRRAASSRRARLAACSRRDGARRTASTLVAPRDALARSSHPAHRRWAIDRPSSCAREPSRRRGVAVATVLRSPAACPRRTARSPARRVLERLDADVSCTPARTPPTARQAPARAIVTRS